MPHSEDIPCFQFCCELPVSLNPNKKLFLCQSLDLKGHRLSTLSFLSPSLYKYWRNGGFSSQLSAFALHTGNERCQHFVRIVASMAAFSISLLLDLCTIIIQHQYDLLQCYIARWAICMPVKFIFHSVHVFGGSRNVVISGNSGFGTITLGSLENSFHPNRW